MVKVPSLCVERQGTAVTLTLEDEIGRALMLLRDEIKHFRHFKKNEPPLPILVGLMIHAKTGKCKSVDRLASKGMRISHDRALEIRRILSNQVNQVPTKLQENMFITITIDNLDHNLTCPISSGYSQMNSRIKLGPLHIEQVFIEVID